jgi:nucleotide-binding universal stress UspA family protein
MGSDMSVEKHAEATMKKILVGVDGSAESRAAAHKAAELARALGGRLVIAYVVAPFPPVSPVNYVEGWDLAERNYATALLRELEETCREVEAIETTMVVGTAAEALADLARAPDVEMVVVGHRGRGAVQRLLLGSVADRLVQISPKPVLVMR